MALESIESVMEIPEKDRREIVERIFRRCAETYSAECDSFPCDCKLAGLDEISGHSDNCILTEVYRDNLKNAKAWVLNGTIYASLI